MSATTDGSADKPACRVCGEPMSGRPARCIRYYAVPDPTDPTQITYWRAADHVLKPWPGKARYGSRLLHRDVPAGLHGQQRSAWVRDWYRTTRAPWDAAVRVAIETDPVTHGRRFAEFTSRCCYCGKTLTDQRSKVYGIGPDCRRGMSTEMLARFAPTMGRAHAVALDNYPHPRKANTTSESSLIYHG
jgi:hypothetical protein